MDKEVMLDEITNYYIDSKDFSGISYKSIVKKYKGFNESDLKQLIIGLIEENAVTLNYTINPYMKQYDDFPKSQQIAVLNDSSIKEICLYPTEAYLNNRFAGTRFSDRPFVNLLYFGKPQLESLFFEMKVLQNYSDAYGYHVNVLSDYSAAIAYNLKDNCEKDKILLPLFELGYKKADQEKVVAACLRDLVVLPTDEQDKWFSCLIREEACQVFGGESQSAIFGEWVERSSIYKAFREELLHINAMTLKIFGENIFKDDFKKSRPEGFNPLFIPNELNYSRFIQTLNSMMADNINLDFFAASTNAATTPVQLFEEWLKEKVQLSNEWDYDVFIKPFRKVNDLALEKMTYNENYDEKYSREQIKLLQQAYEAIKSLRILFSAHPKVNHYRVPIWLDKGDLIIF